MDAMTLACDALPELPASSLYRCDVRLGWEAAEVTVYRRTGDASRPPFVGTARVAYDAGWYTWEGPYSLGDLRTQEDVDSLGPFLASLGVVGEAVYDALDRACDALVYVNVYSVGQRYGGPEEGGWHYDVGTPVEALRVPGWDAARVARALQDRYDAEREEFRSYDRTEYSVRVEEEFPQPFPRERPRYE